jgi:hypothetical protein
VPAAARRRGACPGTVDAYRDLLACALGAPVPAARRKRAGNAQLHVLCHVHTRAAAALAARLLAQARDAVLVLRDPTDVPADEWPALCAVLLATDARLRSLEVQVRGALLSTTSRPVPIAGALLGAAHGASLLTTLALERISLPSALLASPRLEHLRLHSVLPPPHLDWLKQWLRTAPRLRTLVLETDGPLAPASECVDPPHLARVGLEYLFDVVDAFFRTVPVPRESLVVGPYLGKSEESAPTLTPANAHSRRRSLPPTLTPTDAAGVRDLFSRIAEYWQRSHLKMEMPPCHVELRLAYPILVGLLMSTGIMHGGPRTPDTHDDDKLRVAVHMQHIRDLGPFMPFVTSCTVTDATLSETPEWGTDALPNLEQLLTEVDGMVGFEDIRAFQRWADARARAGHAPIVVEVGTRRRLHPAANGTYHMLARWDTGAGLLSKARRRDMPEELDLDRDLECFN